MSNLSISCLRLADFNLQKNTQNLQLNQYTLIYFTKGEGELEIDFTSYNFNKDSLFAISKNQIISYPYSKEHDGFVIRFSFNHFNLMQNCSSLLQERSLFNYWLFSPEANTKEENFYGNILALYKELKNDETKINQAIAYHSLEGILLKLIRAYNFIPNTKHQLLFNHFKALVDENIHYTRNSLYYSDKLNISYKHLNTICKKSFNKTAKEFITDNTKLEIKRKVSLGLSTNEISRKLNFDEPTNFVKYCKHYLGTTPSKMLE